jgi:hypothetical protein
MERTEGSRQWQRFLHGKVSMRANYMILLLNHDLLLKEIHLSFFAIGDPV